MCSPNDGRDGAPIIKNIKCHFKIPEWEMPQINRLFRRCGYFNGGTFCGIKLVNNFAVLRNRYVYTIFRNGSVNVTKIGCECDVQAALTHFEELLQICANANDVIIIDNVQASGNLFTHIVLLKFKDFLRRHTRLPVAYNPEHFPGMNIKFLKWGTILLFASGKYSIVGAKNIVNCRKIYVATRIMLDTFDNYKHVVDQGRGGWSSAIQADMMECFHREIHDDYEKYFM